MMRRLVPLLDHFAPRGGAFREALEWASRLRLPIHALCVTSERDPAGENQERACAETCSRHGVSWNVTRCSRPGVFGVLDFLQPDDLLLFNQGLRQTERHYLFRNTGHRNGPAVLVCPDTFNSLSRILFVQEENRPCGVVLAAVVGLCRALEAQLVVLTVARSEREAWRRQRFAEETVARQRYPADFDFLVGCDLRSAVAHVAQWRRCTHVILESRNASPWYRWLRGDTMERLLGLSNTFTFLALPGEKSPTRSNADRSTDSRGRVGDPAPLFQRLRIAN